MCVLFEELFVLSVPYEYLFLNFKIFTKLSHKFHSDFIQIFKFEIFYIIPLWYESELY